MRCRNSHVLGVARFRAAPRNAIAGREFGHAGTHGDDNSGALVAGHVRRLAWVDALAEIGVDVVHADAHRTYEDLADSRLGILDFRVLENVWTAM